MFYLSGTINVLLFLITRPELLLFPRPKELEGQEIQLVPQGTGPEVSLDTAKIQHSPEPTSSALRNEGFGNSATPSRRLSDDI